MSETNTTTVRRFVLEVLGQGTLALVPELVAEDYVAHLSLGDHYGHEGVRIEVAEWHRGFPDLVAELEDMFSAGDRVARRFVLRGTHRGRFLGFAPTGRIVVVAGMGIDKLAGGRMVESWGTVDLLDLVRQVTAPESPFPTL